MSSRMLAIFQVGRAKGITSVIGADSNPSAGCRTHSAAGDSLPSETPGDTGPAVLAAATTLALRASQAEEAQAK